MARKTKDVTISAAGRDYGKTFRLTEMFATPAEKWAFRAVTALGRAGYRLPEDLTGGFMSVIAVVGMSALLRIDPYEAEPLLDEMMSCVQRVEDPLVTRPLVEDDTEEVATRLLLRDEVAALHVGFSPVERLRTWVSGLRDQIDSSPIPTSEA